MKYFQLRLYIKDHGMILDVMNIKISLLELHVMNWASWLLPKILVMKQEI
jgi:hypothetical protein